MNGSIVFTLCFATLAASLATGCASAPKAAPAAPAPEAARQYDMSEYTAPEEREIYVSQPQESAARKDTQSDLSPSLVTQRKAKMLLPQGH